MEENSKNKNESKLPRTTLGLIVFLFKAILRKKRYWLMPLWVLLLVVGLILFLTGSGALLPAIYMAL